MTYTAKKCGVRFSPPAIVLIYEDTVSQKARKRIMPVRSFSKFSDCSKAAERLKNNVRHSAYLQDVSMRQMERLHMILRDRLLGRTLEQSLASLRLDPNEDLNKLGDEELSRKKARMDQLFEQNRKKKDDPDFVYDVQVDFPQDERLETCSWDEEESDGGF
ncbi:CEP19 protein, partial [Atractosteus spatula]|nr:CEP19 protein [Atractosteus spatula]